MPDCLAAANAKVIAYTVLFSEPQIDPGYQYIAKLLDLAAKAPPAAEAPPPAPADPAATPAAPPGAPAGAPPDPMRRSRAPRAPLRPPTPTRTSRARPSAAQPPRSASPGRGTSPAADRDRAERGTAFLLLDLYFDVVGDTVDRDLGFHVCS